MIIQTFYICPLPIFACLCLYVYMHTSYSYTQHQYNTVCGKIFSVAEFGKQSFANLLPANYFIFEAIIGACLPIQLVQISLFSLPLPDVPTHSISVAISYMEFGQVAQYSYVASYEERVRIITIHYEEQCNFVTKCSSL